MKMHLFTAGLSHKTSPLDIRECLHFSEDKRHKALIALKEKFPESESVIVSTCNRVEIYISCPQETVTPDEIKNFLSGFHDVVPEDVEKYLYIRESEDAVHHLFNVVSGLDSMVIGEAEILGQVKDAYMAAVEHETAGKILNMLFQTSFRLGKRVRSETELGHGRVSVGSVAVDFAEKIFENFTDKAALVIGSGEMGTLTVRHLKAKGLDNIMICSRRMENTCRLATALNARAISFDDFPEKLQDVDIVVSTTSAPHHVIHRGNVESAMKHRHGLPMFFIDLAVPRDIEPEIDSVPNVYLYNIDDLQQAVTANIENREQQVERCIDFVEDETSVFMAWLSGLEAQPVLSTLRSKFHGIRSEEFLKSKSKLKDLNDVQIREVEYMSERIVNKILHQPMQRFNGDNPPNTRFLSAVRELFGLDEETQ